MIFVKQLRLGVQMEIHSVQMTEIEGRRHRIDDTRAVSWRKKLTTYAVCNIFYNMQLQILQ